MRTISKHFLEFLILFTFILSLVTRGSSEQQPLARVVSGPNTTSEASVVNTTSSSGPDNRYCKPNNIPAFGTTDGPATLPISCFYTALSATPSLGTVIPVGANGNLQAAINQAQCGDTITLQAKAAFLSSPAGFVLPAKNCDNNHWITIRTSAPDSSLPPEGSRLTPCYSGIKSLPGRPPFACPSTQVVTAKVLNNIAKHAPAAFVLSPKANHYRFIGLEITRPVTGGTASLVRTNNATQIIFDRVWIHGVANDDTSSAIGLDSGSSYIALIDSYASDFHCEAVTGICTDSHVLFGGLGNLGGGPYKIVDNFLEGSSEGIMFGGGQATSTPSDIEVRRNHFFKPLTWKPGNSHLVTGPHHHPFIVKNNFELKNAQRVLLEGNLLEDVWGGFSQVGFQIVLTPKNQAMKCSICTVADVTVRYNEIRHSGAGLTISSALSDAGGTAQGVENISIHDDLFDDVSAAEFAGAGGVLGLSANPEMFWRDITINHLTSTSQNQILLVTGSINPSSMTNVALTNSILVVGKYQISGTGAGAKQNCAYQLGVPLKVFEACWANYTVSDNIIVGGSNTWPPDQSFPTLSQIGFVNYNGGNGGDYQLCEGVDDPASTCKGASPYVTSATTDGRPVGADLEALNQALAGVD
jgi:hypothetical protein